MVVLTSAEAYQAVGGAQLDDAPVVLMHQLNGPLLRPANIHGTVLPAPLPREIWVRQLVALFGGA